MPLQAEAPPGGGYLQGDDPAGTGAADGSAALSLGQQQLLVAQYQQHQLLLMQRQQALLAEQALQGQAASGSHSVTIAGIEPGQAPAPPNLAERPSGPAGRSRRARQGRAAASGGAAGTGSEEDEEGEQPESDSEGPKPKRRRRAAGDGQVDGVPRRCLQGVGCAGGRAAAKRRCGAALHMVRFMPRQQVPRLQALLSPSPRNSQPRPPPQRRGR